MTRLLTLAILTILTANVYAAPFVVSDPYPKTGSYPDACLLKEAGQADRIGPVISTPDNTGVLCHIDLASIANGTHTTTVLARSTLWGDSAGVPFVFAAGPPAAPSGLTLKAQ